MPSYLAEREIYITKKGKEREREYIREREERVLGMVWLEDMFVYLCYAAP